MSQKSKKELANEIINELHHFDKNDLKYLLHQIDIIKWRKSLKKPIYSKNKVNQIVKKYEKNIGNKKKILILCHGHEYQFKYKNSLLLNRSELAKPDIVSNAWSKDAMDYFHKNYFDKIIMKSCPIGDPFSEENVQLWKNLHRILKDGGVIEINNIIMQYLRWKYNIILDDNHDINNNKINKYMREIRKEFINLRFTSVTFMDSVEKEDIERIVTLIKK